MNNNLTTEDKQRLEEINSSLEDAAKKLDELDDNISDLKKQLDKLYIARHELISVMNCLIRDGVGLSYKADAEDDKELSKLVRRYYSPATFLGSRLFDRLFRF